ncbi:SDR family NAD(P)-dependent oxidoreductase [Streptococcus massiliensis]|uniref:Short chain dehydrogenase/reductase family oxidoreductase n=1 Tax=Streptococcus massiliensis TaxID=313439 RepID=A0A380KUY2_9STRE|nr:SDR family oxidoreductase [Streptococcus massiliensis]SUN75723.1 short chain dehydrogenase/reductase family oxidoreductase [Streptococcus massiliensis]
MRTIIMTGASGGLAQEIVKLLPDDRLILLGRSRAKLEKLYGSLSNAELVELDITDSAAVADFSQQVYDKYGVIDVLVNNAGYGIFAEFDQIAPSEIEAMFEVNTFALMNFSHLFGAQMKAVRKGHIINIVSMAGLIASSKSSLYSATKFAAIGFSNALRLELMPCQVHVTTVNPGPIKTAFFDQADPEGTYVRAVERYILEAPVVARKIVRIFGKKKRELNLPFLLNLAHKLYVLFPNLADKMASKMFDYK